MGVLTVNVIACMSYQYENEQYKRAQFIEL